MTLRRSDGVEKATWRHSVIWSTSISGARSRMLERSPATTPTLPMLPKARLSMHSGTCGGLTRPVSSTHGSTSCCAIVATRAFVPTIAEVQTSLRSRQCLPPIRGRTCTDLRTALERLRADERELIVLKHLDGWTYDELAERLDIPRGTVMSRLFHARQHLKALMSARGDLG